MKNVLKELVILAVLTLIVMVAFFGFMAIVAIMIEGINFLPKYIGGFNTFILYVNIFVVVFIIAYKFSKRQK